MKDILKVELIPDFFYDFIAYLIPFTFPLSYLLIRHQINIGDFCWQTHVVAVFTAYALGLVLPALSWPMTRMVVFLFRKRLKTPETLQLNTVDLIDKNLSVFHEVRLRNKEFGLFLQKRYARVIAIRNTCGLWLLVTAWDFYEFHDWSSAPEFRPHLDRPRGCWVRKNENMQ